MKAKRNPERRQWNLLFFTHTIVSLIVWGFGIHFVSVLDFDGSFITAVFLLLWTILFVVHASVFYYSKGRGDSAERERQSYRDGFNDALRYLQAEPRATHHLEMDEDGELVELPMENKRKRG
jgi:hypothetical protein